MKSYPTAPHHPKGAARYISAKDGHEAHSKDAL